MPLVLDHPMFSQHPRSADHGDGVGDLFSFSAFDPAHAAALIAAARPTTTATTIAPAPAPLHIQLPPPPAPIQITIPKPAALPPSPFAVLPSLLPPSPFAVAAPTPAPLHIDFVPKPIAVVPAPINVPAPLPRFGLAPSPVAPVAIAYHPGALANYTPPPVPDLTQDPGGMGPGTAAPRPSGSALSMAPPPAAPDAPPPPRVILPSPAGSDEGPVYASAPTPAAADRVKSLSAPSAMNAESKALLIVGGLAALAVIGGFLFVLRRP